jgi:maltose-binding protein MalE
MENSLKAILIGAGVVITLIVVSIGFLLMRSGQSTAQNAIGKLDQINAEMSESQYTMYDGIENRGSEVVNVLNKFKDEYIGIQVKTKKIPSGTWYIREVTISSNVGTIGAVSTNTISDTMNEAHPQYVNPNGKFLGSLVRDQNGTVVALIFTQQ